MDKDFWWSLFSVLLLVAVTLVVGGYIGHRITSTTYEDAAVEHGCAEYVLNDSPRKRGVFQWIEPEN